MAADLATYFGLASRLAEGGAALTGSFHHDPAQLLEQLQAGITELEDLSYVLAHEPREAALRLERGEILIG